MLSETASYIKNGKMNILDDYLKIYVSNRVGLYSFALAIGDPRALEMKSMTRYDRVLKKLEYGFTDIEHGHRVDERMIEIATDFKRLTPLKLLLISNRRFVVPCMQRAASTDNVEVSRMILDIRIFDREKSMETLLINAVKSSSMEVLDLVVDVYVDRILELAMLYSNEEVILWAIDKGGDISSMDLEKFYNIEDDVLGRLIDAGLIDANEMLLDASFQEILDVVVVLLDHGADNVNGALMETQDIEIVDLLLRRGANNLDEVMENRILNSSMDPYSMEQVIDRGANNLDVYMETVMNKFNTELMEFLLIKGVRPSKELAEETIIDSIELDEEILHQIEKLMMEYGVLTENDIAVLMIDNTEYMKTVCLRTDDFNIVIATNHGDYEYNYIYVDERDGRLEHYDFDRIIDLPFEQILGILDDEFDEYKEDIIDRIDKLK